jgi:hypothetical protein
MRLYLPCLGLFLILIPSKPLYSFFIRFFRLTNPLPCQKFSFPYYTTTQLFDYQNDIDPQSTILDPK